MEFLYKRQYVKAFDALPLAEQQRVVAALEDIKRYVQTGHAPYGLRIKHLHASAQARVFEARVSLSLRILWLRQSHRVTLVLIGSHDDVQRFLRSFK